MSFCHKIQFSKPYISATQCRRPLKFQTMNSVRSNCISMKYQRFTLSGCEDIDIGKFDFVAKSQCFYHEHKIILRRCWNLLFLFSLQILCLWVNIAWVWFYPLFTNYNFQKTLFYLLSVNYFSVTKHKGL